jgi:hypothetical protein
MLQSETYLKILKIPQLNTIVLKQVGGQNFFVAAPNSIVISEENLKFIIKFLLYNGYLDSDFLKEYFKDV